MYRINREKTLKEQLDIDGVVFDVDLNVTKMANDLMKNYSFIGVLESELKTGDVKEVSNHYEKIGLAFKKLLNIIFTEEQTNKMLSMYEDDYISLMNDLVPFINDVIIPKVRKISEEKQKKIKDIKKKQWKRR